MRTASFALACAFALRAAKAIPKGIPRFFRESSARPFANPVSKTRLRKPSGNQFSLRPLTYATLNFAKRSVRSRRASGLRRHPAARRHLVTPRRPTPSPGASTLRHPPSSSSARPTPAECVSAPCPVAKLARYGPTNLIAGSSNKHVLGLGLFSQAPRDSSITERVL